MVKRLQINMQQLQPEYPIQITIQPLEGLETLNGKENKDQY